VYVTYCSPLTYLVDALNMSTGQTSVFPWWVDLLVMVAFALAFLALAVFVLRRRSLRGL